jgi:hypothetical protein
MPASHKVQDERNYSENEQDVNQPARHMENAKTQQPRYQQNYKQDRKYTHEALLSDFSSIRYKLKNIV